MIRIKAGCAHDAASQGAAQTAARSYLLLILAMLLFVAAGLRLIAITPFPAPDELQHVSYAAALQESGRLLPKFEAQKTLQIDDFTRWTARPNYIGHPSPFYLFETVFLNRHAPPWLAVLPMRLAALALVSLGMWFALRCGVANLAPDRWACALFCATCVLCPRLLGAGSQVTNDALAVLGGCLAFYGAGMPRSRGADIAAGCGLLLALWAKPNAGLEIAIFLAIVAWWRPPHRSWRSTAWIVGALVGLLPYLLIVRQYGAVVPVTAESFGDVTRMPGPASYGPAFVLYIGQTWGHLRRIVYPVASIADWLTIAAFWAMLAGTFTALPRAMRQPHAPGAVAAAAAPLALLAMIPVHFWFAATHLGYSLPAAAFRYYLALWPALAHSLGFAIASGASRSLRAGVFAVTVAALAVGWMD